MAILSRQEQPPATEQDADREAMRAIIFAEPEQQQSNAERQRMAQRIFSDEANAPPPMAAAPFNPGPSGENPMVRARAEFLSDTPEELNAWARRNYGPEADIRKGWMIGLGEQGTPEGDSTYLSRSWDGGYELWDPTQGMAVKRGQLGSRWAEIGAEALELSPTIAVEGAVEAAAFGVDRFLPGAGSAFRTATRGRRLVRSGARTAGQAATAATAVTVADLAEQMAQDAAGTQYETLDEQAQNRMFEALSGAAFGGGLSAVGTVGEWALGLAFGQASKSGRRALEATDAINQQLPGSEKLAGPLAAYISNNPAMENGFAYLSRLSGSIREYQERLREQVVNIGQIFGRSDDASQEAFQVALNDFDQSLYNNIMATGTANNSREAGLNAIAHLGAWKQQTGQLVDTAYAYARDSLEQTLGGRVRLNYDRTQLQGTLNDVRDRRSTVSAPGQGDRASLTSPGQTGWALYDTIEPKLNTIARGGEVSPQEIIVIVEEINGLLANAQVRDSGQQALLTVKNDLNQMLDTIPDYNPNMPTEAITHYRRAAALHRERMNALDTGGAVALSQLDQPGAYAQAANLIYNSGPQALDNLTQLKEMLTGDFARRAEFGGDAAWASIRDNYGVYLMRGQGTPGNYEQAFNQLSRDQLDILFDTAEEAATFRSALRDMDTLHNTPAFQAINQYGEQTRNFVSSIVDSASSGTRAPQVTRAVGNALEAANAAGNTGPQKAFDAGVFDYIINGASEMNRGQRYVDPRALERQLQGIRDTGVYDLLSDQARVNLDNYAEVARTAAADLTGGGGAGIAAADTIARLFGPDILSAVGDLAAARLASNALIASNSRLATSLLDSGRTSIAPNPAMVAARMLGYYTQDTGNVNDAEWMAYERALESAQLGTNYLRRFDEAGVGYPTPATYGIQE